MVTQYHGINQCTIRIVQVMGPEQRRELWKLKAEFLEYSSNIEGTRVKFFCKKTFACRDEVKKAQKQGIDYNTIEG